MALTTYFANKIFDKMFRNQAYTPPTTMYLGLFTADPNDAYTGAVPTGTEVTGGSYARTAIALDAGAARATQNTSLITFPTATASWGTVIAIGIFEAATVGEMMWWDGLEVDKLVGDGDIMEFAAGAVDLSFTASA